ncbi:MAG: hypothetical protein AABX70_08600 [Nanoarchaeota archaeon]
MQYKKLHPNQIITLNDYPVHNEQILKLYFRIFHKGHSKIVPPCPVIHKSTVVPQLIYKGKKAKKYSHLLSQFLETHPKAEYFLIDGSHKTTAATLSHKPIRVMIFRTNHDIKKAKKLVEQGEIISLTTGGRSIKDILKALKKHFLKTMTFQTVEEKTEKMVGKKDIPQYMIRNYNNSK